MPTVYGVIPDVSSHQYILEDASELDKYPKRRKQTD
jgi:hypothetical protein